MENYSKWPVWQLEERLEQLSRDRETMKAEAKHITVIRDEKLSRGETQARPTAEAVAKVKVGFLERLGLKKKRIVPRGPDQVLQPVGIESKEAFRK